MLNFPFYDTLMFGLPFMLLLGVVAAVQSKTMWKAIAKESRQPPDTIFNVAGPDKHQYSPFQAGLTTLAAVVFVLVGGLGTIFIGFGKFQFRSLPVDKLVAIEVYRASDEYSLDRSRVVRIENNDGSLSEALKLLRNCSETNHKHETFRDGYSIRLVFTDASLSDYYVSAFRKSSASIDRTMVMPQREPIRNTNLGEYTCPEFQDWITRNIDPLFLETNK